MCLRSISLGIDFLDLFINISIYLRSHLQRLNGGDADESSRLRLGDVRHGSCVMFFCRFFHIIIFMSLHCLYRK